jgi:tetratricopeptide (TPR) repeat protein
VEALSRTDEQEAVAMGTAFAPSHQTLPPDAARLLRLLALHPGPAFGVEAVSALAAVAVPQARMLLDVLADAGVLERTAPGRHRFAQDRRPEPPRGERAALRRVLDWYLHTAHAAQQRIAPQADPVPLDAPAGGVIPRSFSTYDQAVDWSEREHPNLAHAARAAEAAGFTAHAWQLPAVLWGAYPPSAGARAWLPVGETGLRAARRARNRAAEAALLDGLGAAYARTGRLPEALTCHEDALAIRRDLGSGSGEATALRGAGLVHLAARRLTETEAQLTEALALFETLDAPHRQAVTRTDLAATHLEAGRLPQAADTVHEALATLRTAGDKQALGCALNVLSAVQLETGEPQQALRSAEEAMELALHLRNHTLEARWILTLAAAQHLLTRHAEALTSCHRSATLHRRLGDRRGEALAWQGAGRAFHAMGRTREATAFLSQAAKVHHELGTPWQVARALDGLATALDGDQPEQARRHRREALNILATYDDPRATAVRRRIRELLDGAGR